ncbi:MAG: FkbM family methyltransferase [Acidobacteria bacterium]|nr:FkbM family methyltransferase [Acidobacteriota bacterium]
MTLNPTTFVNSLRLYVPPEYRNILPVSPNSWPLEFEPHCFRGLSAVIQPGATVYDVGASFGIMTALIAHLAGPRGQVVAFEPNPEALRLGQFFLTQNVLLSRVRHVNTLVGESTTTGVPFYFVPGRASVASTRNTEILQFHANAVKVELPMIALDDFDGPVPSVIKVDIEGGEYQFLMGACRLLHRAAPDIVIETHALEINGIAGSLPELCLQLECMGYNLWNLETNRPTTAAEFAAAHANRIGNLLASRRLEEIAARLDR